MNPVDFSSTIHSSKGNFTFGVEACGRSFYPVPRHPHWRLPLMGWDSSQTNIQCSSWFGRWHPERFGSHLSKPSVWQRHVRQGDTFTNFSHWYTTPRYVQGIGSWTGFSIQRLRSTSGILSQRHSGLSICEGIVKIFRGIRALLTLEVLHAFSTSWSMLSHNTRDSEAALLIVCSWAVVNRAPWFSYQNLSPRLALRNW